MNKATKQCHVWPALTKRALIGLGTNLPFNGVGGPALLAQAVHAMGEAGLRVLAASSAWESPAWPPGAVQPRYTNAVVEIDAGGGDPQQLYAKLRTIEASYGRERRERWGPRTLDLDILAVDDAVGDFGGIALPHPRLQQRAFVLLPLAEVAPLWRHPESGETVGALIEALPPSDDVHRVAELGRVI